MERREAVVASPIGAGVTSRRCVERTPASWRSKTLVPKMNERRREEHAVI